MCQKHADREAPGYSIVTGCFYYIENCGSVNHIFYAHVLIRKIVVIVFAKCQKSHLF